MTDIDLARRETIQERARTGRDRGTGLSVLLWAMPETGLVAPWWSERRDRDLRNFWKRVDHLAGAVYTIESRMTTIPFRIEPRDRSVMAHVRQAGEFEDLLLNASEFGEGWETFFGKFITDLFTSDNGGFFEIIGSGSTDGPISGPALGVAHLDSGACRRTGNPEFPVVYTDPTGGRTYRLHYTRVGYVSQMPSPQVEMFGVGMCAVSRVLNIAQNLLDILVYKQEKLGSRPHRSMLVTQGGLDPDDMAEAFKLAEETMDSQLLSRYAKTVVIGEETKPDAAIQQIDLASLPDGFDEQTAITLGMAAIALGFGVDARELFPMMGAGATRADALIQHLKARGKAIGATIQATERLFNQKVLPANVELIFDFQDDAQDRQVAEVRNIRSERHERDVNDGILDTRTAREQMLDAGDLTDAQFRRLELDDGRLEDGTDILTLYFSRDHADLLALGIPDPLDIEANDPLIVADAIDERRRSLIEELASERRPGRRRLIQEALAALKKLQADYEGQADDQRMEPAREALDEEASEMPASQEAPERAMMQVDEDLSVVEA
jgi:hypothetical protein